MPATAREPSGTLVEVLCGQPLQNQGARSGPPPAPAAAEEAVIARLCSLASISATRSVIRAETSASTPSLASRGRSPWR